MIPQPEYIAATAGLPFTKDFFDFAEALINDEHEYPRARVLAWVRRHSWGNFHLYCVRDDGSPALQRDIAADLGIHKGTVSKTVAYLIQRGYLRDNGRRLTPVLRPELQEPEPDGGRTFEDYLENVFRVANAAAYEQLKAAEKAFREARLVARNDYREYRRRDPAPAKVADRQPETGQPETGNPELPKPETPYKERGLEGSVRTYEPVPQPEEPPQAHPVSPPPSPPAEIPIREKIATFLNSRAHAFGLRTGVDRQVLDSIAAIITTDERLSRFCHQIEVQKPRPKSWRYFVSIAEAVAALPSPESPPGRKPPTSEERAEMEELERLVRSDNPEDWKEWERRTAKAGSG